MDPKMLHYAVVASDIDLNAAAANSCDSINMKNYHRCRFIVNYQTIGGAANYVLLYSGATDGALTSALTFRYGWGGAAHLTANADVVSTWATSANLSVAHATYDNYMLVIDIEAAAMDLANNEEWLTLVFADTDTGATGNVSVVAVLAPRYMGEQSVTCFS
ncbi:MAG: hypothetical protein ACU85E_14420 [Gammaproteobacteria bacterium]